MKYPSIVRQAVFAVSGSLLVAMLAILMLAIGAAAAENYDEPYRPQFHFTPAKNWTNDPNGPIFYQGEYHLFYQHNPFGNEWGHMSWGHAVSRDLVHWQHLPLALAEENGIMIFSGSTVVDWHNSSGLCTGSAADPSCLIAIYTGYTGTQQFQNLAYSNDKGRTWTKYAGNPILDLHLKDFRDPKVFWHEATHKWIMVTALSPEHKLRFWGSTDLKHWTALSDFGPAGADGGVWECPDLFELPVQGEPGQARWVLDVNLNPGGFAGGSGDQYFIGQFDGTTFTNENAKELTLWSDYGKDFYASTSFSDIPKSDGRRMWLGWLVNWQYAGKTPTSPWRGLQSIPRDLKLRRTADGIRLLQEPVAELHTLRGQHTSLTGQSIGAVNRALQARHVHGETLEIEAEIETGGASEVGLKVRQGPEEETLIGVDMGGSAGVDKGIRKKEAKLFVDRTHSGNVSFDGKFPGRHAGPLRWAEGKPVKLHLFVDGSSVEVFANDGETVISDEIFPAGSSQGVEFYSHGGRARLVKLDVWNLQSAWK
ncbi:MAG: glycoside hydrolase family 32 protein [Terriglobales bacterium]